MVYKHGLSGSPIFRNWCAMRERCESRVRKDFKHYAGRGIKVCRRWQKFENFHADMIGTYKQKLKLDRINNNKGYSPSNCKWSTQAEQNSNKRNNVMADTPKGLMTAAAAARLAGVTHWAMVYRIRNQWPKHLILKKPLYAHGGRRPNKIAIASIPPK